MGAGGRERDRRRAAGTLLGALFEARAVAIVGASPDSYWADKAVANLALWRHPPKAFTVHPRLRRMAGLPCVRTLASAPFRPDLAIAVVSAAAAAGVVREAADAGVRAAVVVADPEQAGGAAPSPTVSALRNVAAERGIVVLGPGSLGAISPALGAFPFVGRLLGAPPRGPIGIVSQSGAIAIEILRAPLDRRLGISHLLCTGAGSSVGTAAAVEALVADEDTRVIGAHIDGIDDPPRLAAAAEAAHRASKAIVVLRPRRGPDGAAGDALPTRAESDLAVGGTERRVAGFLRHCGIPEVPSLEALVETLAFLAHRPPPNGRRVGVVSVSAGAGRLAADAVRAEGLELPLPSGSPAPSPGRRARRPGRPAPSNPLDLTGRSVERHDDGSRGIREFAGDPAFDAVMFVTQPPAGSTPSDRRVADWVAILARSAPADRPAVPVRLLHGSLPDRAADPSLPGGPFLAGVREAACALAAGARIADARRRIEEPLPAFPEVDVGAAGARLLGPPRTLSEPSSLEMLARFGVPVARWRLCTTATAAVRFAHDLGVPVAVKAASPDIERKAAAGVVLTRVHGDAAVRAAFHEVTLRAQRLVGPDRLLGAVVMEMVPGVARAFAGLVRDDRLGMLVVARPYQTAGFLDERVAVRACPLRRSQAAEMAAEIGLDGTGAERADRDALAEALVRTARLGADLGAVVAALTIGPMIVRPVGDGCAAVDACVVLRPPVPGRAPSG